MIYQTTVNIHSFLFSKLYTMIPLLHLITLLSTFQAFTSIADAQLIPLVKGRAGLPILQDPLFNLRSAENILQSQLLAWGVKINLNLDVDLKLVLLGLDILKRGKDERRSRGERGLLGLNLGGKGLDTGLNLDLDLGLDESADKLDLGAGVGPLDIGTTLSAGKWGQADNAARRERGDTAVSLYSLSPVCIHVLMTSGTPTSRSVTLLSPSPSYPIPALPTSLSTRPPALLANYPTTRPLTQKPLGHSPTSLVPGKSNTTMNPVDAGTSGPTRSLL
jgi:hypothetical protein